MRGNHNDRRSSPNKVPPYFFDQRVSCPGNAGQLGTTCLQGTAMLTAVHSCSWERADKVFPVINFQIDTSHTHPEEIARRLLAQPSKGECPEHLAMYCECECIAGC